MFHFVYENLKCVNKGNEMLKYKQICQQRARKSSNRIETVFHGSKQTNG